PMSSAPPPLARSRPGLWSASSSGGPRPGGAERGDRTWRSLPRVGRAKHSEVRRGLVRKQLTLPAVVRERALEHQHLPVAIRFRFARERRSQAREAQTVPTAEYSHHRLIEFLPLRHRPVPALPLPPV